MAQVKLSKWTLYPPIKRKLCQFKRLVAHFGKAGDTEYHVPVLLPSTSP